MQLVTYYLGRETRVGALQDDTIVDLSSADPALPSDMLSFLRGGEDALHRAAAVLENSAAARHPLASTRLAAPIPRPGKVVAIGLNYMDHAIETGAQIPKNPIVFTKFTTSVIGPGDPIRWSPETTSQVDYEAELVVVIGRAARNVPESDALDYVAGYMCGNDVSARDLQMGNSGQWVLGKSPDTFCPLGPKLVTADEVPDAGDLGIRCIVNGQVLQDSSTRNLIFNIPHLIAFLSRVFTLEPGDVIMTGTPPGVGMARKPQVWLKPGDHVAIEIDGLGRLENPVE